MGPVPPEFEALCSQGRVRVDVQARMHLAQWAAEGVTCEQLAQAIAIARERKPDPELLYVRYLAPIVHDVRSGAATPRGGGNPDQVFAQAQRLIAERETSDLDWIRRQHAAG